MKSFVPLRHVLLILLGLLLAADAMAVRISTTPSTASNTPPLQFTNIALTSDGSTIIANGLFNAALTGNRLYSLNVPANPATTTVPLTQISSQSFGVNQGYNVAFAPVISPNDQTILYTHDNAIPDANTIYTMPIAGQLNSSSFTGLFGGSNFVSPGNGNSHPTYSPDGSTIFFINNESGFSGTGIPDLSASAGNGDVIGWEDTPDWDQLYSVPSAGGTPTAITVPNDGDIDGGLFAVTPNGSSIVYAPDNPIKAKINRGDIRPKLFTVPASGGSSSEISITPGSHEFSIANQLSITPNGQNVLFIADYETIGKNELFSVPITGGAPTRISDDMHFAGDVYSFAIAPDGNSVAYAAGQTIGSNSELFKTPITGGVGNSIRVSDPAAVNSGLFDVSPSEQPGQIVFSPDSSEIYYLGDLEFEDVNDLYVVDTSEKTGLIPSAYTYVGIEEGEFFNESNWEDAQGNNPAADTINPGANIRHTLIIDGDSVVGTGGEVRFQLGGSLELTPGSELDLTGAGGQLQFFPGSAIKLTDATLAVREDIILAGSSYLNGGVIQSFADDIQFEDKSDTVIDGTAVIAADNILFDNSATSIHNATFTAEDSIGLRYEIDVVFTDTVINLADDTMRGGIEDRFTGPQGEGSAISLKGSSELTANAIRDGIDLILYDNSTANLIVDNSDTYDLVDPNGTSSIIFMSTDAEISIDFASDSDASNYVINGLTGLSYSADPMAWNITNWNGVSPLASLQLLSVTVDLDGDYNGDGTVDAADYTVWRDNLNLSVTLPGDTTPGLVTAADYDVWVANYGTTSSSTSSASVPEPSSLLVISFLGMLTTGSRLRQR